MLILPGFLCEGSAQGKAGRAVRAGLPQGQVRIRRLDPELFPAGCAGVDLQLRGAASDRNGEPWCGIQIVDLTIGDVVQCVRLTGGIRELFDVTVLPGATSPMSIGGIDGAQAHVSWKTEFGPLFPETPSQGPATREHAA